MRSIEHKTAKQKPDKNIIIFYHADCIDGFTSAWVAWKKFGNKADYFPHFHDDVLPKLVGKEIYCLDITFPDKQMLQLMKDNKRVTAIDHHISRKEMTLATFEPLYALDHSGCVLSWQYFFGSKPVPKFLLQIEDMDIWRHKIKGGRFLYMYLDLFDFNFVTWSKLIRDFEVLEKRKKMFATGEVLFKHESRAVDRTIQTNAKLVTFEGFSVYAINVTRSGSETGHRLAKLKPPFSIMWREKKDGIVTVSLRGVGNIDCSKIAKKYGGGGHKHSAAFRLKSLKSIPWK